MNLLIPEPKYKLILQALVGICEDKLKAAYEIGHMIYLKHVFENLPNAIDYVIV